MSTLDLFILGILVLLILVVLCGFAALVLLPLRQFPRPSPRSRDEESTQFDFRVPFLNLDSKVIREHRQRWDLLTLREREIAHLAAEGKQNGEIAQALHLRPSTVATHLKSVYKTLGIHSRRELANVIRDIER